MQGNDKQWKWYHGALIFVLLPVFLFGLGLLVKFVHGQSRPAFGEALVGSSENDDYYNRFRQPTFAPPDWVFAPIWSLNNSLASWGIVRVLNMPADIPGRDRFLSMQAAFALQFVNFNAAYFGLRSPIAGALLTVGGLISVAEAMRIAITELKDWRVALSLSTLFPWLILASFTSVVVALWNHDELLRTPSVITPPAKWIKQPKAPDSESSN